MLNLTENYWRVFVARPLFLQEWHWLLELVQNCEWGTFLGKKRVVLNILALYYESDHVVIIYTLNFSKGQHSFCYLQHYLHAKQSMTDSRKGSRANCFLVGNYWILLVATLAKYWLEPWPHNFTFTR